MKQLSVYSIKQLLKQKSGLQAKNLLRQHKLRKGFASLKSNLICKLLASQVAEASNKKKMILYFTNWLVLAGNSIKKNNNLNSSRSEISHAAVEPDLNKDFE